MTNAQPKVLNLGSINIDYVYQVPHFVRPGETLASIDRAVHMGGKGLNQTVAMARAGLACGHAGRIGTDGSFLREFLAAQGADVALIETDGSMATGHTFIQVNPEAENAILYFPGTNATISDAFLERVLSTLRSGDRLVLQNEVNDPAAIFRAARGRGLRIIFNPAPWTDAAAHVPLDDVEALILNETEARGLLHAADSLGGEDLMTALSELLAVPVLILTEGSRGVRVRLRDGSSASIPAYPVEAVDTTGAGDTFTGYAVRALVESEHAEDPDAALLSGLRTATLAAALSVTKPGAASAIPSISEVFAEARRRGIEADLL